MQGGIEPGQALLEDLAQHPELSAADLALLAERTINYALETLARGERVPEGPVRDALGAIACGEKMDPAAADWATLRSVLERSLARENAAATERPPEQKKAARDEEDRPTQTNGQGAQQATSESMGQGGVAKTDAALGELRREPAARRPAGPPRPGAARAGAGRADAGGTVGTRDPLRALTLKRFKEVAKGDTPGVLFQALMGEAAAAAGGRDW